jgi:formimidoylglutamate deiminase
VECCSPSELLLSSLPNIDQRLTAVHCTYTKRKNMNLFAQAGVNVCVCPCTEGFLGDGIPNLEEIDQLCLGTDCNNRVCFFEEMRWLAYGQNVSEEFFDQEKF